MTSIEIPTLDLHDARAADGSFAPAFLDHLRAAAHEIGFLQITGYGGAPGQAEQLFDVVTRFFALPEADRLALDNRRSPHFRGYTRLGHEVTAGRPDGREQLDSAPSASPSCPAAARSRSGRCRDRTCGRTACPTCARPSSPGATC